MTGNVKARLIPPTPLPRAVRALQKLELPLPKAAKAVPQSSANIESDESFWARATRLVFTMSTIVAIGFGAKLSAIEKFTPAEGTGYMLGILGGSLMLLLLLYPLRKRFRVLDGMGSAPAWFRVHMALGVVGPVLILYHSNFSLGATNSNVALFSMLLVAISGIAGRYIYGKVHNGLYGTKADLPDLLGAVTALLGEIEQVVGGASGTIARQLTDFGESALRPRHSVAASLAQSLVVPFSTRFAQTRVMGSVKQAIADNAVRHSWTAKQKRQRYRDARRHVIAYFNGVVKASQLSFYERLFGLWHVLHVPLFFLLIITGVVHVVAVHLY